MFEWDCSDVELLKEAKRAQLIEAGVEHPTPEAVRNAITKKEMQAHCRRRTRPSQEMEGLLEALMISLSSSTDEIGVPLFWDEMSEIWEEQMHYIPCLQDSPGVQLYTITGYVTKGGVRLPQYRCARGSTSLESFHLHLNRYVKCSCVFFST